MFNTEEELVYYIKNKNHWSNQKPYLKYYIGKDLYDLFSFCRIYQNSGEIEFFTLNRDYEDIGKLMKKDYGRTRLVDCEYDNLYYCYTVSVQCFELLDYLRWIHDYNNRISEVTWKSKARNCGWNELEIIQGYQEYSEKCQRFRELHF